MRAEALQQSTTQQRAPVSIKDIGDEYIGIVGSSCSLARKRLFDQSDEEEKEMILLHAERRERRVQKSIKIDEDRLSIERRRVEQEIENKNRAFTLQSERIKIDNRRLEFDLERFRAEREESSAQV